MGLVWTAGFAAAAVGDLSLVSLSVGVLFIGLGVDFAIHLGMAYLEGLRSAVEGDRPPDPNLAAIEYAVEQVGGSFVICTITTAIGFYVFIPTDNVGVAELGLIAGSGMIVNLFLTMTLFPALLARPLRLDPEADLPSRMGFRRTWWSALTAWPRLVTALAAGLTVNAIDRIGDGPYYGKYGDERLLLAEDRDGLINVRPDGDNSTIVWTDPGGQRWPFVQCLTDEWGNIVTMISIIEPPTKEIERHCLSNKVTYVCSPFRRL